MKAHHLTARLWLAGALLAVFLPVEIRLGWWLPLHLALLGAASQLIAGGQIMFSGTLGMAPPARRVHVIGSLALLNFGAAKVGDRAEIAGSRRFWVRGRSCSRWTESWWEPKR